MTMTLQDFSQQIAEASASSKALRIRGGGTKDWYGQKLEGELLDTRAYTGVVSYEPTELVITVRCGTPLAEVEAILAEQQQMLPFEPPRFGADSTIGGVVASGLSGPRRQAAGAVRDFVLGAVLVNGKGEILHFGGQVMKNVAGYDVSRLLSGSLGILGLIGEVSLKVLPRPFFEQTLQFDMSDVQAIGCLNEWAGQPLPITANVWQDGVLRVRLSGAPTAVQAAKARLGGEQVEDADIFWASLRDQKAGFFNAFGDDTPVWRISVPSVTPVMDLPGEQIIEWSGALRWIRTNADAALIRSAAEKAGGHAVLYRGGRKEAGVFHPLAPAVEKIHRNLKHAFDPAGILNRGRMYADF